MKSLLLTMALMIGSGLAFAGELDQDAAYANQQSLKGTVVVRVNTADHSVAYLKTAKVPGSETEAKSLAANTKYRELPAGQMRNELDQAAGASSWYWYPGYNYGYNYSYSYGYNYSQSNLYWYGNIYRPSYYYTNGRYSYYYYSSYSYRWW